MEEPSGRRVADSTDAGEYRFLPVGGLESDESSVVMVQACRGWIPRHCAKRGCSLGIGDGIGVGGVCRLGMSWR